MRKTKILITMGPALMVGDRLREALKLADAVRFNASHGDLHTRQSALEEVRNLAMQLGRHIPVLLDLQGTKWRVGALPDPLELAEGSMGAFYPAAGPAPAGFPWAVPLPHPELFRGACLNQTWVLDEGNIELRVTGIQPGLVLARVTKGGMLKANKGVHPLGLDLDPDPLTPKDLVDVRWGVAHGVDFFAQSFVRRASDVHALDSLVRGLGGRQPIIAKIEHPKALDNLEEILESSWGIMIDRGDLGVELGAERVPALQKWIIRMARQALRPVITATQMMESMVENPQPTRAEASDVANAVWDGTDVVMLSAESAAGKYPLEAIQWLARLAQDADSHLHAAPARLELVLAAQLASRTDVSVAFAACRTAEEIGARLLVVFTIGGGSARMVSRLAGANIPVIGATIDPAIARRLGLMRGIQALLVPKVESSDEMVDTVEAELRDRHPLAAGDKVVVTLGLPLWKSGSTNTMKVINY